VQASRILREREREQEQEDRFERSVCTGKNDMKRQKRVLLGLPALSGTQENTKTKRSEPIFPQNVYVPIVTKDRSHSDILSTETQKKARSCQQTRVVSLEHALSRKSRTPKLNEQKERSDISRRSGQAFGEPVLRDIHVPCYQ